MNKTITLTRKDGFAAAGAVIFVALGILALIAASYYSNFFGSSGRTLTASLGDFVGNPGLEETVKTIVSDLGNVQARSKTGVDGVTWGVCFRNISDPKVKDIYEIASNITSVNHPCDIGSDGTIESTVKIPGDVSISDPGQGSFRYVIFQKITGATTSPTNLNFIFTDGKDSITVSITPAGIITYSVNGAAPVTVASQVITPVVANNAIAVSAPSLSVPSVPLGPAAAAPAGIGRIGIVWSAPSFSGNSLVTEYLIYRSTSPNSGMAFIGATPAPNTVFVDANIINNVTYFYRIAAKNSVGVSSLSAQVFATPLAVQIIAPSTLPPTAQSTDNLSLPGAPWNLSAISGNNQAAVLWTAPISTGSSVVIDYRVYRSTSSNGALTFIGTTLVPHLIDSGLVGGITYYYKIDARNSAGIGPRSNEVAVTPTATQTTGFTSNSSTFFTPAAASAAATQTASVAPSAPLITSTASGDKQVTVSWSGPASSGSSAITGYKLLFGYVSNDHKYSTGFIGTANTFVHTGLTNGTSYYYTVVAVNSAGESPKSNEVRVTPVAPVNSLACGAITAPRSLSATPGSNHSIVLAWLAPSCDGGSAIVSYSVYKMGLDGDQSWIYETPSPEVLTFTDTNLTAGQSYRYWVSALNSDSKKSKLSGQAIATAN